MSANPSGRLHVRRWRDVLRERHHPEWRACREHTPDEWAAVYLRWRRHLGIPPWPVKG